MNNIELIEFSSREALDEALANEVAQLLEGAINERGKAVLVVSGGSTPLHFFQKLSRKSILWEKVYITLADERWVDSSHPDSNEKLLRDNLLKNKAACANLVALKNDSEKAVDGEFLCEQKLSELGQFDVVILGMGGDGHTASLFPQAINLSQGLDMSSGKQCIAIDPVSAPHHRMSMTLPRLLQTRNMIIHITGKEKKYLFEKATTIKDLKQLPISTVIQQQKIPVSLFWAQ